MEYYPDLFGPKVVRITKMSCIYTYKKEKQKKLEIMVGILVDTYFIANPKVMDIHLRTFSDLRGDKFRLFISKMHI